MFKSIFSKRLQIKEPVFPGEMYSIFKLNLEDGFGLATINKAYDNYHNKALFLWYAIVNIHLENQNENGHPTDREAEVLIIMEESIKGFLQQSKTVYFIGRVTRRGEMDLLFYLDSRKFEKTEQRTFLTP